MELAALEVPIRAPGVANVQAALRSIDQAGQKANASLERGAKEATRKATQQYSQMGTNAVRAINESIGRGKPALEKQGQALARSLTAGLRREFTRTQAEIREELARGFITPAQAQERGRQAARAFNQGVLATISQQGAAGAFSGRQGGALFVGLSNQLKAVDQAAAQAGRGGIRTLSSNLAQLAAMELGVRAGLGTTISVLSSLAVGATATVGVVAGLAAIAFAFNRVKQQADAAREATKRAGEEFQRSVEGIRAIREEQLPLETAQTRVTDAQTAFGNATARLTQAQKAQTAATEDVRKAEAKGGAALDDLVAARLRLIQTTEELKQANAGLQTATNNLEIAQTHLGQVETETAQKREQAIISLLNLGRRDAIILQERDRLIAGLNTKLANTAGIEERARLEERLNALRTAGEKIQKQAAKTMDEEVQALIHLANAGLATAQDLIRLAAVHDQLREKISQGTAVERAHTAALLEQAAAADRLQVKLAKVAVTPTGALPTKEPGAIFAPPTELRQPKLEPVPEAVPQSLNMTAEAVGNLAAVMEQLQASGNFEQFLNQLEQLEAIGEIPKGTAGLARYRAELESTIDTMMSLPALLELGGQAWLNFWEAVGSGQNVGDAVKQMFAGIARYFAQFYLAKAMAAAIDSILPPPYGNPALAAAVPALLAVAAAFSAIAGAAGGGGGGRTAASGAARQIRTEPFRYQQNIQPRLRQSGQSETAMNAAKIVPMQPIQFNGNFYGTDRDPKVQKWIADNLRVAQRRGY